MKKLFEFGFVSSILVDSSFSKSLMD